MIWIIGNKGMLAQDVASVLLDDDIAFVGTDREVDICDVVSLQSYAEGKNIEWIVNCSAYTAVDKAEDEPEFAYKINRDGVANIAKVAASIGAKVIHISTDYVFDGGKVSEYTEEDDTLPIGVYGKSKREGELALLSGCDKSFIVRTAWLYGVNGANFVYTMLRLFSERDTVKVVADQFGTPTSTLDLAQAVLAIIKSDSTDYGVYHFTNSGDRISWYDFAVEIYRQAVSLGDIPHDKKLEILPITTEEYPTKATRPANSYLSKAKITKTFSLEIPSWKNGLERFFSVRGTK